MKLVEILVKYSIAWPEKATRAYQSALDSEIYFLDHHGIVCSRTRRNPVPIADSRGRNNAIRKEEFINYQNSLLSFRDRVVAEGGITAMKNKQQERSIQRIKQGLYKDFGIDSSEFAEEMFHKGWRR